MLNMWDEYRDWLLNKVGFMDYKVLPRPSRFSRSGFSRPENYELLMRELHEINFLWSIERDENRMKDGLALRYDFFDDHGVDGSFTKQCSVLEVLVALALRLDCDYIGDPGDPHPEYIFWEMVCNLGLWMYENDNFNEFAVEEKVADWLERRYKSDGKGGIFPLKHVTFDCRNEEIWKLAMAYITENY